MNKEYLIDVTKEDVKKCFEDCFTSEVVGVDEGYLESLGHVFFVEYVSPVDESDYEPYLGEDGIITSTSVIGAYGFVSKHGKSLGYSDLITSFDHAWASLVAEKLEPQDSLEYFKLYANSKKAVAVKNFNDGVLKLEEGLNEKIERIDKFCLRLMHSEQAEME